MKKQIGVLLLVFTITIGLSGAVTAADFQGSPEHHDVFFEKHHNMFFKYNKHHRHFKDYRGFRNTDTNVNNQQVYAPVYVINSPGAVVQQNINSPSATTASNSNLDQSTRNSPRNVEGTTGLHLGAD